MVHLKLTNSSSYKTKSTIYYKLLYNQDKKIKNKQENVNWSMRQV